MPEPTAYGHMFKSIFRIIPMLFYSSLAMPVLGQSLDFPHYTPAAMHILKSTKVIEKSDLFYFGRPLQRPVITKEESWNAKGKLVQIRHWDLHGKFMDWKEFKYDNEGKIILEQYLNAKGVVFSEGKYDYSSKDVPDAIHWHGEDKNETWEYQYDRKKRVKLVRWLDDKGNILRLFTYQYEKNSSIVTEKPNAHGGYSHHVYDESDKLLEKAEYLLTVQQGETQADPEEMEPILVRFRSFEYNENDDLAKIYQRESESSESQLIETWDYEYDKLNRMVTKVGRYHNIPQILIHYRYVPVQESLKPQVPAQD